MQSRSPGSFTGYRAYTNETNVHTGRTRSAATGGESRQIRYGHASLTTTERYLSIDQDLEDAPCDHLGLSGQRAKTGI